MINLRFGLPLFFLIVHQHVSNSVFGLNNPWVSISLFLLLLFSMCFFLLTNYQLGNSKLVAILFLLLFIVLWQVKPAFINLSNLYINFFITYYIVSQGGFIAVKKQLTFLVIISAVLSVIQISGVTPIVHQFNSQFLEEKGGEMIQNIEVHNIMRSEFRNADWYDSRQIRAPGIFHSSALLGGIFVMYIAFVFCGYYKSLKRYAFIPFLCVISGAKLVLITTLLLLIIAILFRRLKMLAFIVLVISSLLAVFIHKMLFYSLINFQFNIELLFFSIDTRIQQYAWESVDFAAYVLDVLLIIGLVGGFFLLNKVFKLWTNFDKFYHFSILIIAVISSFFSTPHPGNLLFGWFYLPAFFCIKYVYDTRSQENFNM